jgi:hypothetical protein
MSTLSVQTIKDVQSFDPVNTVIGAGFATANSGFNVANAAFAAANNVAPQIAPAYNTANAAFAKANSALANVSGSFAGNLNVTGNVGIGITTTVNRLTVNGAITITNAPFLEMTANITSDYTINTGMNALTPGPVAIANNVTVTIPDGSYWSVT